MKNLDEFDKIGDYLTRKKSEELLFLDEIKTWQRIAEEERLKTLSDICTKPIVDNSVVLVQAVGI